MVTPTRPIVNTINITINDLFFTIISIFMVVFYIYLCKSIGTIDVQKWQFDNRLLLSIVFMIFIICTCLSSNLYQKIFSNKVMKFIALISFNLYIYHQFIAVKLKEFRIPYWVGDTPPNMLGDTEWKWTYTILCIVISVVVATIITYLIEKPCAKYLKKKWQIYS